MEDGSSAHVCEVSIGAPFQLGEPSARATTAQLQEYTDQIMIRIAALLPESYRGVYCGPRRRLSHLKVKARPQRQRWQA